MSKYYDQRKGQYYQKCPNCKKIYYGLSKEMCDICLYSPIKLRKHYRRKALKAINDDGRTKKRTTS